MKLKRLAALVLAGVMCLTAFTGCGVKADETIATLGEEKVSYGVAHFLTKYQKATMDDYYAMYATLYGVDSLWDVDMSGSGSTTEEEFKASAMDLLHDMYTLKAHMADYKVEVTAEDEAAIKKAAQAFMAANTEDALKEMGATEEIVAEVLTLYTIQAKMYKAIIVDTDREVKDEDANMRGITLVSIGITGEYNDKGSYVKYTEEQIKSIKATAEKIVTESASVGLTTAAKNNNYTAEDTAYNKNDSTIDKTLIKALNELKEGETSKVIETTSYLYIAKIDEEIDKEATEENREAIIAERESKLYSDTLDKWQKEDGWKVDESLVKKIDFHHNFTLEDPSEKETEKGTEKVDSTEEK